MPGSGRHRWTPDRPLPVLSYILLILGIVDFWVDWVMLATIGRWAQQVPSANHWYQFHMRGSRTYYLTPATGWYLDNDMWIFFSALALSFVISLLCGVRWKRVR